MGMLRGKFETKVERIETRRLTGVTIEMTVEDARWLRDLCCNLGGDGGIYNYQPVYIADRPALRGIRQALTDRLGVALTTLLEQEVGYGEDFTVGADAGPFGVDRNR